MSGRQMVSTAPTINNNNNVKFDVNCENDLKLRGDKIKLEVRPLSKISKASSRCSLIGIGSSRPVSAIPLLHLYRSDEYDSVIKNKRPFSADCIGLLKETKSTLKHSLSNQESTDSLPSFEEVVNLPSSVLLKNLISEPIKSWRNYSSDSSEQPDTDDLKLQLQVTERTPSINSEESLGTKIQAAARNSNGKLEKLKLNNDILEKYNNFALIPGLTTKPPLPKKPDSSTLDNKKVEFNEHNSSFDIEYAPTNASPKVLSTKYNQNILEMNVTGNSFQTNDAASLEAACFWDETSNYKTNNGISYLSLPQRFPEIPIINLEDTTEINSKNNIGLASPYEEQINTNVTEIGENKDPLMQNWILNDNSETEILKNELQTDMFLEHLRKQQETIVQNNNVSVPNIKENNNESFEKLEILSDKDIERIFDNHNEEKFRSFFRNELEHIEEDENENNSVDNRNEEVICKTKEIVSKTPPKKTQSKLQTANNNNTIKKEESKIKPKFTATAIKSIPDSDRRRRYSSEIVSWMSKHTNKEKIMSPKSKENEKLNENYELKPKPLNFLDFLDKLDDLEQTVNVENIDNANNVQTEHINKEYETNEDDNGTFDEIVSILEVLETEDKKAQMKMESMKEIVENELSNTNTSVEDIQEKSFFQNIQNFDNLRSSSVTSKNSDGENKSSLSFNSSTNYNNILSFLDEIDRNCITSISCAKERIQSATQVLETNINLDTIPKLEDLLSHTNVELAHHIIDLYLRVKDKSSSIGLLQSELSNLREQVIKSNKQTEQLVKEKLKAQKEEYESVVKRHQKFIDQLIADKKSLNQQCESLINEMKVLEDRYNSNLKASEHRHQVELQKAKEMHVAGEKIRRDRWIDNKTQKIKEMTVKSIEPELESMSKRHQQELSDQRALHKREIEDLELKAARKTQRQCETLREQMVEEREKALAHERDILRIRYDKLVESEEKGYQEQRRRLLVEHANRIAECEEREATAITEKEKAIKQMRQEYDEKLQNIIRRHNNEIKLLKETTEIEMEAFRNKFRKQQSLQLTEKEASIREQYRKERDKEIEAVIERLEMEANENKNQIEQTAENRIRRIKEKFDNELRDLEMSEKEAKKKYTETKSKLAETEDAVINLKASIKQLEMQLKEAKEVAEKLLKERCKVKEIVRKEMNNEIETMQKEIATLKHEHEKELQQVYSRVKVAVARKDEVISELSRDNKSLQEKCGYLENMLEQQRKEYLMK